MRFVIAVTLAFWTYAPAGYGAKPLRVVTTLTTFADLAGAIGGGHVNVEAIASPKFNPHFIEPRPSDVLKVKRADVLVHAGLDLEAWREPLVSAAGNGKVRPGGPGDVDLSRGVRLLEVPQGAVSRAQGDIHLYGNPHYWLDPENVATMARTITEKLSAIDRDNTQAYRENLAVFLKTLETKTAQWQTVMKPYEGFEVVGYHNEWPYLMEFLKLKMAQFLEPKPGVPPTPRHLQFLTRYARDNEVRGIIQSSYFPTRSAKTLSKRTGVPMILVCQNVNEVKEANDFFAMMDYNVAQLAAAFN